MRKNENVMGYTATETLAQVTNIVFQRKLRKIESEFRGLCKQFFRKSIQEDGAQPSSSVFKLLKNKTVLMMNLKC